MTVEIIKELHVKLTEEEKNTIQSARNIIRSLMNVMIDNHCDWIGCEHFDEEDSNYTLTQIDEADTILDEICHMVEMY